MKLIVHFLEIKLPTRYNIPLLMEVHFNDILIHCYIRFFLKKWKLHSMAAVAV